MKTVEQIYALFIEANPVPDPEVFGDAGAPALALVGEVSGRSELVGVPRPRTGLRRPRWKSMVAAAVVTLLVALGGVALSRPGDRLGAVGADVAVMRAEFDGAACSYDGPTLLTPGIGRIAATRAGDTEPVALLVARITDPSVTLESLRAWADVRSARAVPPGLADEWEALFLGSDTHSGHLSVEFDVGRYLVTCNTSPDGTDRAFPAVVLAVVAE